MKLLANHQVRQSPLDIILEQHLTLHFILYIMVSFSPPQKKTMIKFRTQEYRMLLTSPYKTKQMLSVKWVKSLAKLPVY